MRSGLSEFPGEHHRLADPNGVNATVKIGCLVAGMLAGARAPSTLGSFLRALDWGNVRQLDKVNRLFFTALTEQAPLLLPSAEAVAFLCVGSGQRRVFDPAKQGAAFGYTKIAGKSFLLWGLNALVATPPTPQVAPVFAGTRLRGGNTRSVRGAASFVAEAITAARHACATGTLSPRRRRLLLRDVRGGLPPRRSPVLRHHPRRREDLPHRRRDRARRLVGRQKSAWAREPG